MTVSKKIPIHVDLSVAIVKHGYSYVGVRDLGDVDGKCEECGHPIRYEHRVKDHHDGHTYVLGSECIYKLVALDNWESQINYEDLLKKQLLRAGKWRWILSRDGLLPYANKIPQPKDFAKDYKDFADAMKRTVFAARKKAKAERKSKLAYERSKMAVERRANEFSRFLRDNKIDEALITSRERDFLRSVIKRNYYGTPLSEKQQKWFDDIKDKKAIGKKPSASTSTSGKSIESKSFSKMPTSAYGVLTEWEKKFVKDIKVKVDRGDHLTEKQINQANRILAKMKSGKADPEPTVSRSYVRKKTTPWITNQKTGQMRWGFIDKVHKETEKAIYCDITVGTSTYLNKWVPKSQVK